MTDPMDGQWADLDNGPTASAQMIQWHAPQTWAAVRDTIITEMAARDWQYADPAVNPASRALSRTRARLPRRSVSWAAWSLGYVVVEYDPVDRTHRIEDTQLFDRSEADRVRDDAERECVAVGGQSVFTVAEVHEAEETTP